MSLTDNKTLKRKQTEARMQLRVRAIRKNREAQLRRYRKRNPDE